jgi:hypothetical protein
MRESLFSGREGCMDLTPGKGNDIPVKHYKGEGRVTFLANLDSIRNEVEAGWPLQAVYDRHKDRLNIQYMQFHRYVRKFITGEAPKRQSNRGMDQTDIQKPKLSGKPSLSTEEASKKNLNDATPLSDSELF